MSAEANVERDSSVGSTTGQKTEETEDEDDEEERAARKQGPENAEKNEAEENKKIGLAPLTLEQCRNTNIRPPAHYAAILGNANKVAV